MERKSQAEVIEAIRSISESTGSKRLSRSEFLKNSDVTIRDILRYFPKPSAADIEVLALSEAIKKLPREDA